MSVVLDILFLATAWGHVLLAPYTKVEESFNLHATHDVLMHGISSSALPNYDHVTFPGAVPRTFIGSILLAWISTPILHLASTLGYEQSKVNVQVTVRLVLATLNALSYCFLRRAVSRRYGGSTSVLFTLLSCTQFHVPFWMGRTLPNMFALIPTNVASALLMNRAGKNAKPSPGNVNRAIALLTFTAAVLRAEVALFLAPLALQYLVFGGISFTNLVKVGVLTTAASIAATTLTDSFFWQQWPLWPELNGVLFNVVEGKSAEWGVSPFRTYFTTHLPKMLLSAFPLSIVGLLADGRIRSLLLPVVTFVLILSSLAHKEWRFVVYTVPLFTVAGARGASWIINRKRRWLRWIAVLFVSGLFLINGGLTYAYTRISMENYPGGAALERFNELYAGRKNVHVHISNLAAQTGASLFLQTHTPPYILTTDLPHRADHWTYDKTENLTSVALTVSPSITHIIAECPDSTNAKNKECDVSEWSDGQWEKVDTVKAFAGWTISPTAFASGLLRLFDMIVMVKNDALVILEKK